MSNDWLKYQEAVGRRKIIFSDVLNKYECWKEKCVKSALGGFNSGMSIRSEASF